MPATLKTDERTVPGDSYLLHAINLPKYFYSSHYPACLQDKKLRTIAHCQLMKQLFHTPSPKTKYLIKEIKINYGICTARCYRAGSPVGALGCVRLGYAPLLRSRVLCASASEEIISC